MALPLDPIGGFQILFGAGKALKNWWKSQRPLSKLLQGAADNNQPVRIFVRDLMIPAGSPLLSKDAGGIYYVPNVENLWPRVEGLGIANVLNVLGQAGKVKKIDIIEMSKDNGLWESHIFVMGAQAQKCYDFYSQMKNVAYYVNSEIKDKQTNQIIPRENGYGYGVILKAINPYFEKGVGFLIGGYGVLGTEAANYYFWKNAVKLGKQFGSKCFGVIVRASITAGIGSTERLNDYDKVFE